MFTPVVITRPSRSHARLGRFALRNVRFSRWCYRIRLGIFRSMNELVDRKPRLNPAGPWFVCRPRIVRYCCLSWEMDADASRNTVLRNGDKRRSHSWVLALTEARRRLLTPRTNMGPKGNRFQRPQARHGTNPRSSTRSHPGNLWQHRLETEGPRPIGRGDRRAGRSPKLERPAVRRETEKVMRVGRSSLCWASQTLDPRLSRVLRSLYGGGA